MPTPNQYFVRREEDKIAQKDLLNMDVPGKITEQVGIHHQFQNKNITKHEPGHPKQSQYWTWLYGGVRAKYLGNVWIWLMFP